MLGQVENDTQCIRESMKYGMQIIIQEQDSYVVNAINRLEGAKTTQYILRMELGRFVQNAIANRMNTKINK